MFPCHASGRSNYPGHSQFLLIICFIKTRSMWATRPMAPPLQMQGSREAGWAQSESNALTQLPLQDAFHRTVSPSLSSARNICCDPPHPPRLRHATLYNHKPSFLPLHNRSPQIRVTEWNGSNVYSCNIYTFLTRANGAPTSESISTFSIT